MSLDQPDIRPILGGKYVLHGDYNYEVMSLHPGFMIEVPDGFRYDGASVPRFLWSLSGIRPDGIIRAAALIHDFVYRNKGWDGLLTRKEADQLFRIMIRQAGGSWWKAWKAYRAVRLFGRLAWGSDATT